MQWTGSFGQNDEFVVEKFLPITMLAVAAASRRSMMLKRPFSLGQDEIL